MAEHPDTPSFDRFNSIAIKSFRTDDKASIKGKLVRNHYTSANALMAILRPDSNGDTYLRFTDIHYMNDKSEKVYFIRQLLRYLKDHRGEYPFCEEVVNQLLLEKNSEEDYINLRATEIKYLSFQRHFVWVDPFDALV